MKMKSLLVAGTCLIGLQAQSSLADIYGRVDFGMAAPLSFSDTAPTTVNEKMYEGNKPGATTFYGFGFGASISNFRAEAMFSSLNEVNFEYNAPNEKIAGTQLTGNQKIQQKI